jgi:flavin reductase (DIM6/NTAB) family NADH-FMN oxidoreductase RutF
MENLDSAHFRNAVSRFTTGVTIVTSRDKNAQAVGMTANSFMSVSLKPPMILVSLMESLPLTSSLQMPKISLPIFLARVFPATHPISRKPR